MTTASLQTQIHAVSCHFNFKAQPKTIYETTEIALGILLTGYFVWLLKSFTTGKQDRDTALMWKNTMHSEPQTAYDFSSCTPS